MAKKDQAKQSLGYRPLIVSAGLVVSGLLVLIFVFAPIVAIEIDYLLNSTRTSMQSNPAGRLDVTPTPVSSDFGIVIPKIRANAPIIRDVDPFDSNIYQQALAKGVAHAKGTATPDQAGNTFLFAHSAENWLNASRYNAIFYLIRKLERGDKLSVYFKGKEYVYIVRQKQTISAEDVDILTKSPYPRAVTLMTCWPPGTTLRRTIVVGELQEVRSHR